MFRGGFTYLNILLELLCEGRLRVSSDGHFMDGFHTLMSSRNFW